MSPRVETGIAKARSASTQPRDKPTTVGFADMKPSSAKLAVTTRSPEHDMRATRFLLLASVAGCLSLEASLEAKAAEYGFSTYVLGQNAFSAGVTPPQYPSGEGRLAQLGLTPSHTHSRMTRRKGDERAGRDHHGT